MLHALLMSSDYTLILRACPESHRESAAGFVSKLFSLKEHTCQQIVSSCPIVLLTGLGREEAATMHLLVHGLNVLGAHIELSPNPPGDLPKIDWPRRPQVFKRELSDWGSDLALMVPVPGGQSRLIDLLVATIEGRPATKAEFKGANLPEVTPFATPALPIEHRPLTTRTPLPEAPKPPTGRPPMPPPPSIKTPAPEVAPVAQLTPGGGTEDPMSRLNELFPEEDGGSFMPGKEDITNILNRLLPDEQPDPPTTASGGSRKLSESGTGGFSVFLAKIADEDRRKKAAALIAEMGKMPVEEAEILSKKMIIPVLKGVSKEEADAAKAQFGKIGILARVKGPE